MSWFGTFLCQDTQDGRLLHRGLESLRDRHSLLGLEPEGEDFVLSHAHCQPRDALPGGPAFKAVAGMRPGCLTLAAGRGFVTAQPDGELRLNTLEAREWEQFLPVQARDLLLLREILARRWSLEGQSPVPAGLAEFQLKFGDRSVDLAANLPFPAAMDGEALRLVTEFGPLLACRAPDSASGKQIWINPMGNIGNRALQYLTAAGIAARVPGADIRNLFLEMWGRHEPAPRPRAWESAATGSRYHLDIEGLADCLIRGEANAICIDGYTFHLDHYPPRGACRALFPASSGAETVRGFGPHELVCSIRGAEILQARHPDYFPLPPAYYARLQQDSGLDLVFFGQLGDDPYSLSLRAAFPRARFVSSVNQNHDFEVLRRSRNVALSISTFAWLAAWLGEAERIYLPVGGMFSPAQHPGQFYLPLDEPAYRYVLLPPVTSFNLEEEPARFWLMQDLLARRARFIGVEELRGLSARAARFGKGRARVKDFNGAAYLAANPDVANEVRALRATALGHYLTVGVDEHRLVRPFDPLFYADTYPDAADAVALAHYPSLFAHFLAEGEGLGYLPGP